MTLTRPTVAAEARGADRQARLWTVVTVVEVVAATALVVLDVLVPSVLLVAMAAVSLAVRRRDFPTLGFHRPSEPGRLLTAPRPRWSSGRSCSSGS